MKQLTDLPNVGKVLAEKLKMIGVNNEQELKAMGSENAIIKIETIEPGEACFSKLCAIEGAIQGIRWHELSERRKQELKEFFKRLKTK